MLCRAMTVSVWYKKEDKKGFCGKKPRISMETDKLYRVVKEDLPKLEQLLGRCFAKDPLYETLIPDETIRERLLPELFHSDLTEFFESCQIFADSPALNGILVVEDEAQPCSFWHHLHARAKAELYTDSCLIREDPSLKTLGNFMKGGDYLNERWTEELHETQRLHIIYLAVDPDMQHRGIAAQLMNAAIDYAEEKKLMVSLETHNARNLAFYHQFGFEVYEVVEKNFKLKQYCLIRKAQTEPEAVREQRESIGRRSRTAEQRSRTAKPAAGRVGLGSI